jgi:hypothetical protein
VKIVKDTMDENFLQSPMPFINKMGNWIYGQKTPKLWVKVIYSVTSLIGLLFFVWHILGFSSVLFRKFVFAKKQIAVDEIIKVNAKKLGYTFEELISYLQIHHVISAFIWLVILWVLVLLWRGNKKIYLYLIFLLLFYFLQGIYFFGWRFITDELTIYDWSMFMIFSLSLVAGVLIQLFFKKDKIEELDEN